MNEWLAALIAVIAGFILGSIAGRLARRLIGRQPNESIRSVAGPLSSLVVAIFVIGGLITALGFVSPDSLDQIPADLVNYLPRVLAAAIVLIGASVIGSLFAETARRALRGSGVGGDLIGGAVRSAALVAGAILAGDQLGFDTTIINLAAAALMFALAGAFVLMVGLGGRNVAAEVAAGRSWHSMIELGSRVRIGHVAGTVVDMHPVGIELDDNGQRIIVPNSRLLTDGLERLD